MSVLSAITFSGGLALFLYGMTVMSASLEKASGGKLEHILEKFSNKPIKGLLLGLCVTAVIQSSSAVSVMTVGFVNSGIMQLSQAVGILMGANIGTTVTAWILSLSGLQGSSLLVTIFKPATFSPVLALTGIVMLMFVKKDRVKNVGTILVGFGVLMFGMETMTDAVKPLANTPAFAEFFLNFSNPAVGVIFGTVMTMIMQSSSASVGILQAFSLTGGITYSAAIPIILGQNIGTCITALISSVGASKNAKRTAMIHLYFNIIGTILFLIAFYSLDAFLKFDFIDDALNPANIAVIHSAFNLLATLVLFPFSELLVKLATVSVRDKTKERTETTLLDERFLNTPSFAIEQCRTVAAQMAELAKQTLFMAISVIDRYDEKTAQTIRDNEEKIDMYEDAVGTYIVKVSSKNLSERDSNDTSKILHSIGDFERIGDHASNLLDVAEEMHRKEISFSEQAKEELRVITGAVKEILDISVTSFVKDDTMLAVSVEPLEEVIDKLHEKLKKRHVERLKKSECTIELGFIFSDLLTNYERVADHCSNIAICVIQSKFNAYDPHEYLNNILGSKNSAFLNEIKEYKEKYALPPTE